MTGNNYYNFNRNFSGQPYGQRRPSPLDGLKRFFTSKSTLSILIIINIAVFLIINFSRLFFKLYLVSPYQFYEGSITVPGYWLAVPADLGVLILKPWTIITYMFTHESIWHLFFNMLMLYVGGIIFTEYLTSKRLLLVYILGGVTGALFYILSYNIFPAFTQNLTPSVALGASASVMAIIIAIAAYVPDYPIRLFFLGAVKFKWIALAFVVYDLWTLIPGQSFNNNPGGHIAHLGGAFFGFFYILALKKGLVVKQLTNPFKKWFVRKPKVKNTYSRKPKTDDEYRYVRKAHQQRIDDILDKIKKSGYESLSKEDKEYLFKESKNK
ncbi:MAG TPA: rhomboid family intramembrane serine protease [Bacteroidales bacterium]|nr:rhomboid family intramembrane serine protease [Bacteroidales bacterium]HPS26482.1 rhomboid family intramembrane serine protease [Bacteroidales bacterium]